MTPAVSDPGPAQELFCIPLEQDYLVYAPVLGLLMRANAGFVNALEQAQAGNWSALRGFGLDDAAITTLLSADIARTPQPLAERPFAPTSASLFLTTDCTLRCLYCYADGGRRSTSMDPDLMHGVVDAVVANAVGQGQQFVTFHFHGGGDASACWPLLVEARGYIGQAADAAGLRLFTTIGTNGMLDADQRAWLVAHINAATVSVDGLPALHDRLRPQPDGAGSYAQVSQTLHAFDAAGFDYGIRSTVTADTVAHLAASVEHLCTHFGVKALRIEPLSLSGRAAHGTLTQPGTADFIAAFRAARAAAQRHGRELRFAAARASGLFSAFCAATEGACGVTPEGLITSCYEVLEPTDPLADVFIFGHFDRATRRLVVDEAKRARLRLFDVTQRATCARCFCKYHCAGDCAVRCVSGGPGGLDRCTVIRALITDQLLAGIEAGEAAPLPLDEPTPVASR